MSNKSSIKKVVKPIRPRAEKKRPPKPSSLRAPPGGFESKHPVAGTAKRRPTQKVVRHFSKAGQRLRKAVTSLMAPKPVTDIGPPCPGEREVLNQPSGDSMAALFMNPDERYEFRLSRYFSVSASAGGVCDTVVNNDPTATEYKTEYDALALLFSYVRIREARMTYFNAGNRANTIPISPTVFNGMRDSIGTPGSYLNVIDTPGAKFLTQCNKGMDRQSITVSFVKDPPVFSDVGTPIGSIDNVGCPGAFQLYGDTLPPSAVVLYGYQELILEFTNRI